MADLYYAMCFDEVSETSSNFYHCIALAEDENDFRTIVLQKKEVSFAKVSKVVDYLKETGYKKEILDLSQKVDEYNLVVFSDSLKFFSSQDNLEEEKLKSYVSINEFQFNVIVPIDKKPFWDQEWLDPEAKKLLFPQNSNLKTFAILDGAIWNNANQYIEIDLEQSRCQFQSLFQGKTQEEMGEIAPYLVDMSINEGDEDNLSLKLHRFLFGEFKEQAYGIYFQSSADFHDLRNHFRKFTRVQKENQKWYYLRFFDPRVLQGLVQAFDEDDINKFFPTELIDAFYIVSYNRLNEDIIKIKQLLR